MFHLPNILITFITKKFRIISYKKDFLINNHTADVYAVSKKVDQINFINDYKNELFRNKF